MITDIVECGTKYQFTFHTSKCATANKLRQIIMLNVPTLAIDTVEIEVNSSRCHDEILAHRLGLIPFSMDEIKLNEEFQVELNVTAAATEARRIYSRDLQGKIKPVHEKIIICNLYPGESIKLKAHLKIGTGLMHAKWTPISNIVFIQSAPDTFKFEFQTCGVISGQKLIESALAILNQA